jgi:ribosomal-protein-alanine N-acetyltransferase
VRPPGAVLVGRRVFIRPPTVRDRDSFLALVRSSRARLRPWVDPPADHRAFTAYLRRSRRPTERAFLVCRRQDGAIAGVISVSQIFLGSFRSAYLGYYAGAAFMGQGYMSEGLRLVLRHAFGKLGLHRLEANIQPANRTSTRLVRRDHVRWAVTVEDPWR